MSSEIDSFGRILKAFRLSRYLTQQQLADKLGVRRNTIGSWERGDCLPGAKAIVLELARHLRLGDQETRQLLEASLTALAPHWSVPLPRIPYFTGREEILLALRRSLSVDHTVALTQASALSGLGGIGKTQTALEYAYRYALEYSAVFWIVAETAEQIISSFLRIADVLQVPVRDGQDQQRVIAAVQQWLNTHSQWLLIWDNVEDLSLLERFLPAARAGAILLTTRHQALGTCARGIDLLPMEQEEGMLLVLRRAKVLEAEATGEQVRQLAGSKLAEYIAASKLVEVMGGLPLALDQAGAYIDETGCSLADYLQRYEQQRLHLLGRRGMERETHPLSVVATFELACQRIAQQNPASLELLRFCACLYPDAIPEELLLAGADHLGPALGPVVADVSRFDEALATLRTFSLIQRQPEAHTLSLHRLVQVILLGGMSEQEKAMVQRRVASLLNTVFPDITPTIIQVETWELRERLLPQVLTCLAALPEHLQDQDMAAVLLKAAAYLDERSQWEQAERLCQRAVHIFEHILGPEHPQVGSSLSVLVDLYKAEGHYEQAERLCQRALRIHEEALGPEHPEVALLLCSMGDICYRQGRYGQAQAFCRRALRIQEQALGETHPDLTASLTVLGCVSQEQRYYEQAELLFQRVLEINEEVLSPEHPDLARALNNLGAIYIDQRKYAQAEPLCQRAVFLAEHGWGGEHHNVAAMLDTLATLYREMGNYEQAKPLYQRALQITERTRGSDHPCVAYALHGLAILFQHCGEYEQAEGFYQRALAIREQHLGPQHPETAHTLHDLATFLQQQGKLSEALSLARRALQICEQTIGDTHPKTVATRTLYAQLVQAHPRAEEERDPQEQVAKDRRQIRKTPRGGSAPASTPAATVARASEHDPLEAFLSACCELHPLTWCRISELWHTYEHWTATEQRGLPLPRRAFAAHLKARGCRVDRTNTARIWRGVRLVKTNP